MTMKFMLIMQGTQGAWEKMATTWSQSEFVAHIRFMKSFNEELKKSGEFVLAEGLDVPTNAKVVSAKRADVPTITDGPFPETKEFLAGFWIVDVPSAERAIQLAAKASTAPGPGGAPIGIPIEIRQVMSAPPID
jgi:hypothetical protein